MSLAQGMTLQYTGGKVIKKSLQTQLSITSLHQMMRAIFPMVRCLQLSVLYPYRSVHCVICTMETIFAKQWVMQNNPCLR